jgi:hypothetical protein
MKDDTSSGGVAFTYDGAALTHWYETLVPGAVAIHCSATTLTALHEFGHASASATAGMVIDLYADTSAGYPNEINFKSGRPIPATFATLNGITYASDTARDGLAYPASWTSYHGELIDATRPALMDQYKNSPQLSEQIQCQHDRITRRFLIDRLAAKTSRA